MNILLTSVGRRSYIVQYFKDAVGSKGKVIACNSEPTYALTLADKGLVSPMINEASYIDFLIETCKQNDIRAVMSLFDIDLPVLASNADRFAGVGCTCIGPSHELALIGNDKLRSFRFFSEIGLQTPKTYASENEAELALINGEITFPVVIKPRWGMGSIGVYIAESLDELRVLHQMCRRIISNSYLKHESTGDLDRSVLVQEMIVGQEYGIDIFKDLAGNFVSAIAKRKVSMRSGETDVGETSAVELFAKEISAVSKGSIHTGILSLDIIASNSNVYCIELNCRISGHYPFSHLAGVRYPEQLVAWLEGKGTDYALMQAEIGVRGCKTLVPAVI